MGGLLNQIKAIQVTPLYMFIMGSPLRSLWFAICTT